MLETLRSSKHKRKQISNKHQNHDPTLSNEMPRTSVTLLWKLLLINQKSQGKGRDIVKMSKIYKIRNKYKQMDARK